MTHLKSCQDNKVTSKKWNLNKVLIRTFLLMCLCCFYAEANDTLTVTDLVGNKTLFTSEQLLQHPDKVELTLESDIVYPDEQIVYDAIPVYSIIDEKSTNTDSIIQFKATDGFSAPLPQKKLLNKSTTQAIAYIAIESAKQKWPNVPGRNFSAGPFYLIWKNAHLSDISVEDWPFQLAEFEIKSSFESSYPDMLPGNDIVKTSDVYLGFQSFVRNCFACHKMNNEGEGAIGPDLNLPMNPTEYFKRDALKKLIRDPASVRTWPNQLMGAFNESMISDSELDQLVEYMSYMRNRKVAR